MRTRREKFNQEQMSNPYPREMVKKEPNEYHIKLIQEGLSAAKAGDFACDDEMRRLFAKRHRKVEPGSHPFDMERTT
jgi:hypothetical protein